MYCTDLHQVFIDLETLYGALRHHNTWEDREMPGDRSSSGLRYQWCAHRPLMLMASLLRWQQLQPQHKTTGWQYSSLVIIGPQTQWRECLVLKFLGLPQLSKTNVLKHRRSSPTVAQMLLSVWALMLGNRTLCRAVARPPAPDSGSATIYSWVWQMCMLYTTHCTILYIQAMVRNLNLGFIPLVMWHWLHGVGRALPVYQLSSNIATSDSRGDCETACLTDRLTCLSPA